MPEKWEYWSTIVNANIENKGAKEYLARQWPDWNPPKYTPETMIPVLNAYGEAGWEMVLMQPVANTGANGDIYFNGEYARYSNSYFCVFKRRKAE